MFELMVKEGLYPYYKQWLRDIVEVFGEVHNFMTLNTITCDLENFYDGAHVYPSVGRLIAHRVIGAPDPDIPGDFGVLVTRENIEGHLRNIDRQVKEVEARL